MDVGTAEAREVVRSVARRSDIDRYLSALLSPSRFRDDLISLAAFSGSVLNLPHQVREPQIGEIRVQWWRDALVTSTLTGDPVADTFADVVRRRQLPADVIERFFDEVVRAIYGVPIETQAELDQALDATQGSLFALAQDILGDGTGSSMDDCCRYAGRAYGLAQRARCQSLGHGQGARPLLLERDERAFVESKLGVAAFKAQADAYLAAFRSASGAGRQRQSLALLPVALVEPYFKALSGPWRSSGGVGDISPFARASRLALARLFWARVVGLG